MDISNLSDEQVAIALKVIDAAKRNGINPDFVLPMVAVESNFNPNAKSKTGALGVMQLMPNTAKELGVDPSDVDQNIEGGVKFLKSLSENPKLGGDPYKILSAYNAGPNHKFFETGDMADLPDETVSHVLKVRETLGSELPSVISGSEEKAEEPSPSGGEYGPTPISQSSEGNESEETPMSRKVAGLIGSGIGGGAGSIWATKVPVLRVLQKLGAFGEKKVSPEDAVKLAERVIKPVEEPMTAGDKWSQKVVGSMGPGGEGVTEAARNYRIQQSLTPKESSSFRVGRSGIIEPNVLETGPEAQARIAAQEAPPPPAIPSRGQRIARGTAKVLGSAPIRGALAGYGTAANLQDLYGSYQDKDKLGMGIAGTGALSSLATAFPGWAPGASSVAAAADAARRARQGDVTGAAISGGSALAPWIARGLMGAEAGGPLGAFVGMAAPTIYDLTSTPEYQKAHKIPVTKEDVEEALRSGVGLTGALP